MAVILGWDDLTAPEGNSPTGVGDDLSAIGTLTNGPYTYLSTATQVRIIDAPPLGQVYFDVELKVNGEVVVDGPRSAFITADGTRTASLNLTMPSGSFFYPAGGSAEIRLVVTAIEDENEAPVEGSVGLEILLARVYAWTVETTEAAVDEDLMSDLRALYAELVTDGTVPNDRAISVMTPTTTVAANGERTTSLTATAIVYGMIKYLPESAATRALGRPTGERVVEITIPYSTDNPEEHVYQLDGVNYYPIPGDNNMATSYRANTRFRAKARS